MTEIITSRENPRIKELAGLLTQKKHREAAGLFALEGLRLCRDAAESGLSIHTLYLTPEASRRYPQTLELMEKAERVVWIHRDLARRVADTREPQGVFGICRMLDNEISAVTISRSGCYLILDRLQDPGNLGTILRTAQALGIDGVYACGCPDLYAPKVLRSAMGGLFRLPVATGLDAMKAIDLLRQASLPVYGAALTENARPIGELDPGKGCGMLIGNEGGGLDEAVLRHCDGSVIIPMHPQANSLNASAAAAILIWEMTAHHRAKGGYQLSGPA